MGFLSAIFGGPGGETSLPVDQFNEFLQAKRALCPFCDESLMTGISYQEVDWPPSGNDATEKSQLAIISRIDGDSLNEGLGPAQGPSIYVLPAMCDRCGNIELFSLGTVLSYFKEEGNGH